MDNKAYVIIIIIWGGMAETERGQAPQHALLPVLSRRLAGRAYIKTFPPSLPQEHVLCLPSHSGHGRREIVEETDLSVPRRLGNPVQVGDTT